MKGKTNKVDLFMGLFSEIPPDCIDFELLNILGLYVLKNLLKIHGKTIATLKKHFGLNELIWPTSVKCTLQISFY